MTIISQQEAEIELAALSGKASEINTPLERRFAGTDDLEDAGKDTNFSLLAAASLYENNEIFASIQSNTFGRDYDIDLDYDFRNDLVGYEQYGAELSEAVSKEHAEDIKKNLDLRGAAQEIIDESGALGIATAMTAGISSPTSLLPISLLGKGKNIVSSAAKVGGTSMVSVGAQELMLQEVQSGRSDKEVIFNTLAGGVVGGLLGGAFNKQTANVFTQKYGESVNIVQSVKQRMGKDIAKVLREDASLPPTLADKTRAGITKEVVDDSVGAARVQDTEETRLMLKEAKEARAIAKQPKSVKGYERLAKFQTPMLRAVYSPMTQAGEIMRKLVSVPLYQKGNMEGVVSNQGVEDLLEITEASYVNTAMSVRDLYRSYTKRVRQDGARPLHEKRSDILPTIKEKFKKENISTTFMEEVGEAMTRGDKHNIPEVQQAAKAFRKVSDDLAQRAVDADLFKEFPTVETAESHFMRVYDIDELYRDPQGFKDILREHFRESASKTADVQLAALDNKIAELLADTDAEKYNMLQKAKSISKKAIDNPNDLTSQEISAAVKVVEDSMPNKPQTLSEFIIRKGGIRSDLDGMLQKRFVNKPGIVDDMGVGLDDLVRMAEEEGFIKSTQLADVDRDFLLRDIEGDLDGIDVKVRKQDETRLAEYQYYDTIRSAIKGKKITKENIEDIKNSVVKLIDGSNQRRVKSVKKKMEALERQRQQIEEEYDIYGDYRNYADDLADQVFDNVTKINNPNEGFDFKLAETGPLKGRTLTIEDEKLGRYLVKDAIEVMESYTRRMAPQVMLAKQFGSVRLDDILAPLKKEFSDIIDEAKTGKERKAARELYDTHVQDIKMLYEMQRGVGNWGLTGKGPWQTIGRNLLMFNTMRMLGGVAIASLPDAAKLIGINGNRAIWKKGVKPFVKNITANRAEFKKFSKEMARVGIGTERVTNSRLASFADIGGAYRHRGMFENLMNNATKKFINITGLNHLNDTLQLIGSYSIVGRIYDNIDVIKAGGKLDKKEVEFLSFSGLSVDDLRAISKEKVEISDGVHTPLMETWNRDIRDKFLAAIRKNVDIYIVKKRIGDVPSFANTAFGKLILQFKSFVFASQTRTFMNALQRGDGAQLAMVNAMIAFGALSYIAREYSKGKDPDFSTNNLIMQGIDRSGLLHVISEVNNISHKVAGPSIQRMLGLPGAGRYQSRSVAESFLGPSLGTVANLSEALYALNQDGDMTDAQKNAVMRMVPLNNLFYLQMLGNLPQ